MDKKYNWKLMTLEIFLLFLSITVTLLAQNSNTGSISGHVYEETPSSPTEKNKKPISKATVYAIGIDGRFNGRHTKTDKFGSYRISGLPPGRYYLKANYPTSPRYEEYESRPDTIPVYPATNVGVIDRVIYLKLRKSVGQLEKQTVVLSDIIAPALDQAPIESTSLSDEGGPTSIYAVTSVATQNSVKLNDSPRSQLVNTLNAVRGGNVDSLALTSLPLGGIRTIEPLGFLFPGVAPPPLTMSQTVGPGIGASIGTGGQFSVNGLRSRANNFTIDGSDNNDEDIGVRRQGFTALLSQSVESVQDYHILTLLPTPQFGRNLSAQNDIISRSGSTRYNGTLYGFFTNDHLKARDFFDLTGGPLNFPIRRASDNAPVLLDGKALAPANPVEGKDRFTRRQLGFVLGGPIGKQASRQNTASSSLDVIERKTLFFLSFENQKIDAGKESHFAVPTVADRGVFGSGDGSRPPQFPSSLASLFPSSVTGDAIFSLYPFPNNPRGPYGANTFTQILSADAKSNVFSLRLDRAFDTTTQSDSVTLHNGHTLGGRYNFTDDNTVIPTTGGALFSSIRALVRTQNLSLFYNAALSPNFVNEFRSSYGRTSLGFKEVRDSFLSSSVRLPKVPFLLNAGLISNVTKPGNCNGQPCFIRRPGLTMEDILEAPLGQVIVSGYSPVGVDVFNFPQERANNTIQVADTLFYNRQRNRITAGFDLRRTQLNSKLDRNFRPLALFNGAPDVAKNFGFSNFSPQGYFRGSDFVAAGAPTGFFQTYAQIPDSTIGLRYWQKDVFGLDEIRLRSNLTLTIGARYQYNSVPNEVNHRIEDTFNSTQVKKLINAERELNNGVSGFEKFLAGRQQIYNGDGNNIAPHLAFAWDPFGKGTTSIRWGYGIYYDQIPGSVISQSRSVFPSFLSVNLAGLVNPSNPSKTDLFAFNPAFLTTGLNVYNKNIRLCGSTKPINDLVDLLLCLNSFTPPIQPSGVPQTFPGGPGFVLPAADLKTPYSQHWGLTIEHEFKRDFFFSVAYVGTRGIHLLRFATPNLGPNVIPVVTQVLPGPGGTTTAFQGFAVAPGQGYKRPFPLLGSFTSIESDASSTYHSLQAEFNKRFNHGIQFTTAYTWSHAIDEVSDLFDLASGPVLPQNSFDRRAERASASFDIRHSLVYSLVWDLPTFTHNRLLNGWRVSSIGTFRTGQPFSILACCDVNLDGNLSDRLNTVAGIKQVNEGQTRFMTTTADQFSLLAEAGKDGALGRNTFHAPGTATIDLALNKTFEFKDQRKLEVRTEFFNLFNRTQFGIPVHQLLSPGFGRSVDTRLPSLTIQIAGKFSF